MPYIPLRSRPLFVSNDAVIFLPAEIDIKFTTEQHFMFSYVCIKSEIFLGQMSQKRMCQPAAR